MAEPNRVDQVLYAWRVLQTRVNSSLPSWTSRVRAARTRIVGVVPPPPTNRGGDSER